MRRFIVKLYTVSIEGRSLDDSVIWKHPLTGKLYRDFNRCLRWADRLPSKDEYIMRQKVCWQRLRRTLQDKEGSVWEKIKNVRDGEIISI